MNTVEEQIIATFMEYNVEVPQKGKGSSLLCIHPNELRSICYTPMFTAVLFTEAYIQIQCVSTKRRHKENIKYVSLICIYAHVVEHYYIIYH